MEIGVRRPDEKDFLRVWLLSVHEAGSEEVFSLLVVHYSDDDGLRQDTYMSFMKNRLQQPDFYALDDFVYNRFAGLDYAHACVNGLVRQ